MWILISSSSSCRKIGIRRRYSSGCSFKIRILMNLATIIVPISRKNGRNNRWLTFSCCHNHDFNKYQLVWSVQTGDANWTTLERFRRNLTKCCRRRRRQRNRFFFGRGAIGAASGGRRSSLDREPEKVRQRPRKPSRRRLHGSKNQYFYQQAFCKAS